VNQPDQNLQTLLPEHLQVSDCISTANFSELPAKPAVYVLVSTQNTPILLAATSDLRRAVQNRLLPPPAESAARPKVDYCSITSSIRYAKVGSAFAASWWYYRAARSLFPGNWRKMVAWKNAWYISVDPEEEFPRFICGQNISDGSGLSFGPIPGRTTARCAVSALEEMFDLCRYYDVLRQAPHGQACAYKQMGKCPAPCDGTIDMAAYHQQIRAATYYLCNTGSARNDWNKTIEVQMRRTAAKMEFHTAAALKNKLAEAGIFNSPDLHYADRLDRWACLSFQYGQTDKWIEPFLIRPGGIQIWPQVRTRDLDESCRDWFSRIAVIKGEVPTANFPPSEIFALACYHFHRSRDAGCYILLRELSDPEALEQRLNAWLAGKRPVDVTEVTSASETSVADATPSGPENHRENYGSEQ